MATTGVLGTQGITLRVVEERAQKIYQNLGEETNRSPAIQEIEKLYHEGVQLVAAQSQSKSLFPESVFPVVVELEKSVSLSKTQNEVLFHRSLSKVYCLFIELAWHQWWKVPLTFAGAFSNLKKDPIVIHESCKHAAKAFSKNEMGIRFEYSCAREAAKLLILSDDTEFQYKKWYLDVHRLRWISVNVRTKSEFEKLIQPELDHFKVKGGKYTLCLVTIFMELLQSSLVEEEVKQLAAQGLKNLCLLKDKNRFSNLQDKIKGVNDVDLIKKTAQKADRYYLTRCLVLQYVEQLIKNKSYQHLIAEILKSFEPSNEKESIEVERAKLLSCKEENVQFIKENNIFLSSTRGDDVEEAEILEAKKNIEENSRENEEIDSKIKVIDLCETVLEALDKEEQDLLGRVQSILKAPPRVSRPLFGKWKYGQRYIFVYHLTSDDKLSALIQDQTGHQIHLTPDQVKCGIKGTMLHSDFIRKINKLVRKRIVAFSYPSQEEATEVWIFQSSKKAAPWIKEAKENLAQIRSGTDDKTVEVYRRVIKSLETALEIQKKQKGNVKELQSFALQLKKELLLLQANKDTSLYLSSPSEIEKVRKTLESYHEEENIFANPRRPLAHFGEPRSPAQNLIAALVYEILDNPASAIESYLNLAKQELQNPLPCLKKAVSLAKAAPDPSVFSYFLEKFWAFLQTNFNPSNLSPELKEWIQQFAQDIKNLNNVGPPENIDETHLINMGQTLLDMGKSKEASDYLKRAFDALLTKDDVSLEIETNLHRLGEAFIALGKFQQANTLFQKALDVHVKRLGKNDLITAVIYDNLGKVYLAQENFDKALPHFEKSKTIRISLTGKNDRSVALSFDNIGEAHAGLNEFNLALASFQEALEIRSDIYKEQAHPDMMKSFTYVGNCYSLQGKYADALTNFQKALEMGEKIQEKGEPFLNLALLHHILGANLGALGKHKEALPYIKQASNLLNSISQSGIGDY